MSRPLTTAGVCPFEAMGCEIIVGGADARELAAIEELFVVREDVFSRFRSQSELAAVNESRAALVAVSPLFADTLRRALTAAAQTDGLVDPTLAAALESAGYDRDLASLVPSVNPPRPPSRGQWRAIRLTGRLLERPPGLRLDLNGVVKAMAVDDALGLIAGDGFVAAGGDIATRGGTLVGLPGGGAVQLVSGGMATSGTTRRRWLRAGGLHHHLIDPRTGSPSSSCWSEVTVAAGTCLGADVAAKAAFLLGEEGPAWLDTRRLPGRFLAGSEVVLNEAWRRSLGEVN